MSTFTSPFTGTVVTPTDVSYYALAFSTNTQLYWPTVVNPQQVPAARIIDCVPGANGLIVYLPDASQGATGSDILFRNLGSRSFVVANAAGGATVTIPAGIGQYFYLTDNTSVAGVWGSVTFGAGTSVADAAALQGAGLATSAGKLVTTQNPIVFSSSNPVVNDASRAATYVWSSGAGTLTLPSTNTLSTGWYIGFRNNGTGTLTISTTSPDLINNQASLNANPGDSGGIFYDPSSGGYITVGYAPPANINFTAATYDVDSIVGNTFSLVSYAPIIQTYIAQTGTRTQTLAVTLPEITQIYVLVNNTNQSGYNITFQCQGSSQPPLVLASGEIVTILTDGANIYTLTSATSGVFYAADGSAGVPSYSFTNDTQTGMYLPGLSILGFSANGSELLSLDNTNVLQPLITANGRFVAQLINGGTF